MHDIILSHLSQETRNPFPQTFEPRLECVIWSGPRGAYLRLGVPVEALAFCRVFSRNGQASGYGELGSSLKILTAYTSVISEPQALNPEP